MSMVDDDLVSIIVPVYGVEPYLRRCVDSLLAQTHRNIEIILVDDGSTDRSGEICDEYATLDARVRVIHQPNAGVSVARNTGIEAAGGRWLSFVDPDDWIDLRMIANLLESAADVEADLVVCGFQYVEPGAEPVVSRSSRTIELTARRALTLYGGPQNDLMTSSCAKLYLAALVKDSWFPVDRFFEDEFFTYRVVAQARKVATRDDEMYYYYLRPESSTRRKLEPQALLDRSQALRQRAVFMRDIGLDKTAYVSYRKAFYFLRLARNAAVVCGDSAVRRAARKELRTVAKELDRSQVTLAPRLSLAVYRVAPRAWDIGALIVRAAHRLSRRDGAPAPGPVSTSSLRSVSDVRQLEVVVVAYGHVEMLREALAPIAGLPLTVVDNSSMPEIAALCREIGCRYLDPNRNTGFSGGVNIGLRSRLVEGGDVLLLNPDAIVTPDAIAELQRTLHSAPDIASVGPVQFDSSGVRARVSWPFHSPLNAWLEQVGLWRLRKPSEFVMGSVLLLRAEALAQVGAFDERFFLYFEETDWAYRAQAAGWRHVVAESATAVHVGSGTSESWDARQSRFRASEEEYYRKHFGAAGWRSAQLARWTGTQLRRVRDRMVRAPVAADARGH